MRESQHRMQGPPAKCRLGNPSRGAQPSSRAVGSGGALLATRPVVPPQCPVGVRWHARFQKRCSHFQSCPHCCRFQATVSSVRRRPKTREDWRCAVWLQPKQLALRMFLLKSRPLRRFHRAYDWQADGNPNANLIFPHSDFPFSAKLFWEAARQQRSIVDTYGARFFPPADIGRVVRKPELARPFPTESRQSLKCPTRRSVSPPLHPETGMAFLVLENCNPHDVQFVPTDDKVRKTAESNTPERGAALVKAYCRGPDLITARQSRNSASDRSAKCPPPPAA